MRSKWAIAALVAVVAGLGTTIALSGGSSKGAQTVRATPAPTTVPPTATRRSTATRLPPLKRTPGPTHPTVHAVPPAPSPAACRLSAGVQTIAGRIVIIDLPATVHSTPAPVVIDFHAGNRSAEEEHGYTGLGPAGASRGFIVVTPNGTGGQWNFSGTEPLPDDTAFVDAIAQTLTFAGCSNGRLYTAGMSDGADMAIAAACRVAAVRAVFAVAPSITPRGGCVRKSFVEVHGTADPIVPYYGRGGGSFPDTPSEPVTARLPFWTNGCSGPVQAASPGAETTVRRWTCPGRTVDLVTVNGGGHTWPGAVGNPPVAGLGARAPWSADAMALTFFYAH